MQAYSKFGLAGIWLALIIATLASGALGIETPMATLAAGGALLAITFAKVLAILFEFMELRSAPRIWKILPLVWLVAVIAIIFTGYAVGLSGALAT